jgi:hypothetical protein
MTRNMLSPKARTASATTLHATSTTATATNPKRIPVRRPLDITGG